jgi:calreticulin
MSRLVVALALLASVNATVFFEDRFTNGMEKWKSSNWKPDEMGTWTHTSGEWFGDEEECKGMATTDDMKHHAISAQLDTPASTTGDKPLIVQFTVKHEKKDYSFCGGGYIKLLSKLNQDTFGGDDEYEIMFGPDLCGYDVSRIHLIFNHEKENLLKDEDIKLEYDEKNEYTHLYTLILENDGTYQVLFDEKEKAKGKLSEEWGFPSEFIKDPEQSKPKDWVDVKKIEDPEEVKPEGYDDIKAEIPDPDAEKPDDWDDEDDGEWEAPLIDNPEYKGPWKPTMIDNPEYKGPWEHPMIPNPDYKPNTYAKYDALNYIGFELWTVNAGSIFDNILITDDKEYATQVALETFHKIIENEEAAKTEWKKLNEPESDDVEDEEDLFEPPAGDDDEHSEL